MQIVYQNNLGVEPYLKAEEAATALDVFEMLHKHLGGAGVSVLERFEREAVSVMAPLVSLGTRRTRDESGQQVLPTHTRIATIGCVTSTCAPRNRRISTTGRSLKTGACDDQDGVFGWPCWGQGVATQSSRTASGPHRVGARSVGIGMQGGTLDFALIPKQRQRERRVLASVGAAVCGVRQACLVHFWTDRADVPTDAWMAGRALSQMNRYLPTFTSPRGPCHPTSLLAVRHEGGSRERELLLLARG